MKIGNQRRLAANILKIGINKVWLNPSKLNEIKEALTKTDVSELIKNGIIKTKPEKGVSRVRARKRISQRRKGRQKGKGHKKGKRTARLPRKLVWMIKVRGLRKLLHSLKQKGIIDQKAYRTLYKKIKGNIFRSRRHMMLYIKEQGAGETSKKQRVVKKERIKE